MHYLGRLNQNTHITSKNWRKRLAIRVRHSLAATTCNAFWGGVKPKYPLDTENWRKRLAIGVRHSLAATTCNAFGGGLSQNTPLTPKNGEKGSPEGCATHRPPPLSIHFWGGLDLWTYMLD